MRTLLAFILSIFIVNPAWAELTDVAAYLPEDSDIVISINCEKVLAAEATKVLLGDQKLVPLLQQLDQEQSKKSGGKPNPPETYFAVEQMSAGKHVTLSLQIFDASAALVEGNFDAMQFAREAREFAEKNKRDFTTEKVGDKEIVRIGKFAFCVVNKSLLAISDSPPPGSKEGGFLSASPGAAEKVLKQVLAHAAENTKAKLNPIMTAQIGKVSPETPFVALLGVTGAENPAMVSTVRFAGNDLKFRLETTYADAEKAKTGEVDVREGVQSLIKELGDAAVTKAVQAAKIERRDKQVIVEALIPAVDLKPSFWKLLQL
jgi:hypothetical protein